MRSANENAATDADANANFYLQENPYISVSRVFYFIFVLFDCYFRSFTFFFSSSQLWMVTWTLSQIIKSKKKNTTVTKKVDGRRDHSSHRTARQQR